MDKMLLGSIRAAALKGNAIRFRLSSKGYRKIAKHPAKHPKKKKFKQGWRVVGERRVFFRSCWEANFGRYLEWQKKRQMIKEWEHEPQTFWFEGIRRGCVSYLPDFKVTELDGNHYWIEVKGFMDAKSFTKIKRFKKFFPNESLRIIDAKWYNLNVKKLCNIVPDWEKEALWST